MSDDQPLRSQQRYSRFSRSRYANYEDLPPQDLPEDTSLADIAARALRNERGTDGTSISTPPPAPAPVPAAEPQREPFVPLENDRHVAMNGAASIQQEESWLQDLPPPPEPFIEEAPVFAEPIAPQPKQSPLFTGAIPVLDESEIRAERLARGPFAASRPAVPPPPPEAVKRLQAERERSPNRAAIGGELLPPKQAKPKVRPEKVKTAPSGPSVLARSTAMAGSFAKAARAKAVPVLTSSAFWIANNLRRRELRKRYCETLVFSHNKLLDRGLEKLFRVPTVKMQRMAPAPGIAYEGPVPSKVFDWIMSPVPGDLREFAFIDMRSGLGRTLMLAARRNFDRIIGYEYDEQVYDDLRMNIAQFPRSLMVCRDIDCYRGDIDGISLPDQPCIIYFSAAWREPMIAGVMDYVRHTYRQSPRRIYVILENVDDRVLIEDDGIFHRIEPAMAEKLKLRLFSPMDFRIYRTTV